MATKRRRPALAYRFDDNIIVEDEDGEVIRQYKLPKDKRSVAGASSGSAAGESSRCPAGLIQQQVSPSNRGDGGDVD